MAFYRNDPNIIYKIFYKILRTIKNIGLDNFTYSCTYDLMHYFAINLIFIAFFFQVSHFNYLLKC